MEKTKEKPQSNDDLSKFIESIPPSDEIRERIAHNAREISVLKRVLKLSVAKETNAREVHRAS